jgi:hypothetical protein
MIGPAGKSCGSFTQAEMSRIVNRPLKALRLAEMML